MGLHYHELEKHLENACSRVQTEVLNDYSNNSYISAGGAKLEAFISRLQEEFETVAAAFLKKHKLEKKADARRRVLAITKVRAKKCIENFGKIA